MAFLGHLLLLGLLLTPFGLLLLGLKLLADLAKFLIGLALGWFLFPLLLAALALGLPLLLLTLPLWFLPALLTLPLWFPIALWALPLLLGTGLGMILKGLADLLKFALGSLFGWLFPLLVLGAWHLGCRCCY
ncbi:hypothetical protein [Secundilactobacillus kimchicus]|uniref:hypothetical protein n=1 Tax=Secundilactobacillus kimchicus TaxID=528209 RepID=UPI0024371BD3|nr:hypothetical protein [Secundilactobacillus kimchicus]